MNFLNLKNNMTLFSDTTCNRCNKDPGFHPNNPLLWRGFRDEKGKHICLDCKDAYYRAKGFYKNGCVVCEFPVQI